MASSANLPAASSTSPCRWRAPGPPLHLSPALDKHGAGRESHLLACTLPPPLDLRWWLLASAHHRRVREAPGCMLRPKLALHVATHPAGRTFLCLLQRTMKRRSAGGAQSHRPQVPCRSPHTLLLVRWRTQIQEHCHQIKLRLLLHEKFISILVDFNLYCTWIERGNGETQRGDKRQDGKRR